MVDQVKKVVRSFNDAGQFRYEILHENTLA
jgi:hypothetical protein